MKVKDMSATRLYWYTVSAVVCGVSIHNLVIELLHRLVP